MTISIFALASLTGCGGSPDSDSDGAAGQPAAQRWAPVASYSQSAFVTHLQSVSAVGYQLLAQYVGAPKCGVEAYLLSYSTVGAAGEPTTATAALMVPSGAAAPCTGARPMLLYGHGTATTRSYNMTAINDSANQAFEEALTIASAFVAQGYIVVAPNYVGHGNSTLTYHPYLVADQQSTEMIDALTAARSNLTQVGSGTLSDNGKLFISGYSEGGFVALATQRALQAAQQTVTASAPMSGPYAIEAQGDATMFGRVPLGAPIFVALMGVSYQRAYGNLFASAADVFEEGYVPSFDALSAGTTDVQTLLAQDKLPQTALFSSTTPTTGNTVLDALLAIPSDPLWALGFGPENFVKNSMRVAYAQDALTSPDGAVGTLQPGVPLASAPAHPLREAFRRNDLRNGGFVPQAPTLLCGGAKDPSVFFALNAGTLIEYWQAQGLPSGVVSLLDLEGTTDPLHADLQQGFAVAKQLYAASAVQSGAQDGGASAVVQVYHGILVPPFCTAAVVRFFATAQ